jgi:hypothetical protein
VTGDVKGCTGFLWSMAVLFFVLLLVVALVDWLW